MISNRLVIAVLVSLLLATPVSASVDSLPIPESMKPYVDEYYYRSDETPAYLLFESYLQSVSSLAEDATPKAMDYVVDTLHFGHSREGEARGTALVSMLLEVYDDMNAEILAAKSGVLCSIDPYSRKADEVVTLFNSMDAVGRAIAWKYFHVTLGRLEPPERRAFRRWIVQARPGYFYASFDHRFMLENSTISPQIQLEQACIALQTARHYYH